MMWTTRLRRHGGMRQIAITRLMQAHALQAVSDFSRKKTSANDCLGWLDENPLRVLSAAEERFFGIITNR